MAKLASAINRGGELAKLALINRDLKRARTVAKFAEKRAALKSLPPAQPLRFDGASPWYVPQVRLGSYQDS